MTGRDDHSLFATLLEAIDRGEFMPGDRLVETELAERYSVSRTPVREALNRLESVGVAARDGKRGLTVAQLDHDQLGELYDLREVLEGFAARLAARRASPAEIATLREFVEEDTQLAAGGGTAQDLAIANKRFHRQLHHAAHNRYLLDMLDRMRRSMVLVSGTTLAVPGRGPESVAEHDAIVSAIEARDELAAETAAREHIFKAYRTRLRLGPGEAPPG
ncbi:MAG: GntR family transcriptional regulator [Pseudomonadota bacterium]